MNVRSIYETSCFRISDIKLCVCCKSEKIIKNDFTKNKKQQYYCKDCPKRFIDFYTYRATKHYYIGSERISAKTGTCVDTGYYPQGYLATKMPNLDANLVRTSSDDKVDKAENNINYIHEKLSLNPPALNSTNDYVEESSNFNHLRNLDYFYFHPDHLGSSSYITNAAGTVSQHMEYLPFGELLVDEHTNSYNSPFKYNGKEFDEETGNYYYSARYYDPKWSIFISVDPLAKLAPDWTPYRYGFNNPVKYTDPTGMYEDIIDINVDTGKISITEKAGDDVVRFVDDKGKVKDSYTYGENGSFRKDFKHTETKVGAVPINELRTDNVKQADKLFEKISQNSNIEWEHMVISHKSGWHDFAVLGNTGRFFKDGQSVGYASRYFLPNRMKSLINDGYTLKIHEHNHPFYASGNIADWPSGYNRKTREIDYNALNDGGDAGFARDMRLRSGYKQFTTKDTKFYIRPQGANYKVEYNGTNPYKYVNK